MKNERKKERKKIENEIGEIRISWIYKMKVVVDIVTELFEYNLMYCIVLYCIVSYYNVHAQNGLKS